MSEGVWRATMSSGNDGRLDIRPQALKQSVDGAIAVTCHGIRGGDDAR